MADPKIKYDIEANVTGAASVDELANQLEDMSKVLGSDLSATAQKAAAQLRELAQQQAAIDAFKRLALEARSAEQELALAQKSAKSYGTEIAAAGAPTAQQAAILANLSDKVQASATKLTEQKAAVQGASQELLKYGLTGDRIIEAQKQTTASVDALKTSVQAAIPGFKALGADGATSAKQIQDAWSTLGVKSFQQTQVEISKIKTALETVKATSKDPLEIKIATQSAQASIAQLEGGVKKVDTVATGASAALRTMAPLMATAFGAQQFIETITSAESLNRSYEQIFGSMSRAREEMNFIKTTANRLGLETLDLAKSYQSLAASTKGTVMEGQATRDVFEAVARAMATLGKSSADTERALTAISQMASKGTVSMEELRGQLGEALPGAMKAAADGAGITVQQLVEMVSSGDVLAKDIIPALTNGLNNLYAKAGPPDTVISEWNRFKNAITETSIVIGEGGASKGLASIAGGAAVAITQMSTGADVAAKTIADLAMAIRTGSLDEIQFAKHMEEGREKIAKVGEAAGWVVPAIEKLGASSVDAGEAGRQAFRKLELAAQNSGTAVVESSLKVLQHYTEMKKGSADYVVQVEKEVAARGAESAVLTQLVNVYGTEIEKRQVAVSVAQTQAEVSAKAASARNIEAIITQSYVIKLQEMALATNDTTEETKKAIVEAQKSAQAKQTEYERTDAVAKAKRIDAEATKAQAQALQDNSEKVGEYQYAMQLAAEKLERLIALKKEGKATDAQVTDAQAKLAAATLLYRDALSDTVKKAELKIAIDRNAAQLAQGVISVDKERVKAAIEVANAMGDSAKATRLQTEATQLDIKASQASADAARQEAILILDKANKREAELKGRGELNDATRKEIADMRQSAEMKELDAQKADILTEKLKALTRAHQDETSSLEAKNAAMEKTISAQEKANDLIQRAIDLQNKKNNVDREGFTLNTAGQRVNMQGDTQRSVYENAKGQGLTEAQALQISDQFIQNGKQVGYGGANAGAGENWGTELQKAIDKLVLANASKNAATGTPGSPTTTVNVRITPPDGKTYVVPTTQSGSQELIAALQSAKLSAGI